VACLQIVKNNTAFDLPREKLKNYFSRGDLFFSRDIHLCFACGSAQEKNSETGKPSLRALFIKHVLERNDDKMVCVRAETAATELLRQIDERGQNISEFERVIAETVNSVLIFPESPGSFAELGYFSAHEKIGRKTLVAVLHEHQSNSFINLGPIHAISKWSIYAPIPYVMVSPLNEQMPQIVEKLLGESQKKRAYRDRFELQTWKDYDSRHQLAILDEIIDLAGAITEADLRQAMAASFGAYDISKTRLQMAILVASGRIVRNDNGDIFSCVRRSQFIESNAMDRLDLKAGWQRAYEIHDPSVLIELEEVNK
jgi:hypothetical protein